MREALGFPDDLYEQFFGEGPRAQLVDMDPVRVNTELCVELELVTEFANGSIASWQQRSWAEQRMWIYYRLLQNEKKRRAEERAHREAEAERERIKNMPKVDYVRPGLR